MKLKSTTIQQIQVLSNKFINGIFGVHLTWLDCNIIQTVKKMRPWMLGQPALLWTTKLESIKKKNNIQEQNSISDFLLLTNIYTSTI